MHTVLDAPQAPPSAPAATAAGLHVLVSPGQYDVFERARQLLAAAGISLMTATGAPASSPAPAFEAMRLREVEGQLVRTAMQKAKGNVSRAARALGLSRSALYRRLERHGLTTAGELVR
jgi:transcriptional regulator of acetoin/glycerol metabolism